MQYNVEDQNTPPFTSDKVQDGFLLLPLMFSASAQNAINTKNESHVYAIMNEKQTPCYMVPNDAPE